MPEIEYGPVFVTAGQHKGRIFYYDDDDTAKTTVCYVDHPLSFAGNYLIPLRYLREPTIDDLMKRREELWRTLSRFSIDKDWEIHPADLYDLWAEKSLVDETLTDRRMFGELGKLDGSYEVFLCHCSDDKGRVRMLHDDLKHQGVSCWLDENKIKVGDSIVSKISSGLASSKIMIVFLSKSSIKSMWARKEWQSFLTRQLSESGVKILPALLEDCEVPTILVDIKYADFRESYLDGFRQIHEAIRAQPGDRRVSE